MAYHYLFLNGESEIRARVRYSITPGAPETADLVIEDVTPPDFKIGPLERLTLRRNAAFIDCACEPDTDDEELWS